MIVGITGGRDRHLTAEERHELWSLEQAGHTFVVGDCPTGIDRDVARTLTSAALSIETADPNIPSPRRFHERNQRIVDQADRLIAFPSKRSRGTWQTVRRAQRKGIPVDIR